MKFYILFLALIQISAHASYLEKCNFKASCKSCDADLCEVELLEMKIQPGSHGDYKCNDLMKKPNQSIAIKDQKPSEGKCGLQYFYYNSRGPGGIVEGESWKVIKLENNKQDS